MTYKELLDQLKQLTPEQREQEIMLIPDRLNQNHDTFGEWFPEQFSEDVELRIAKDAVLLLCELHPDDSASVSIAEGRKGMPSSMFDFDANKGARMSITPQVEKGMPYLRMFRKNANYLANER